jgi:hypothetical protein
VPANAPHQDAPQILGRAGVMPEIAERPALEKLGFDFASAHHYRAT